MVSYTLTDPGTTYKYWVFINKLCPLISICSFKNLQDSLIIQFNAYPRGVFSRVGAPKHLPRSLIPTKQWTALASTCPGEHASTSITMHAWFRQLFIMFPRDVLTLYSFLYSEILISRNFSHSFRYSWFPTTSMCNL